MTRETVDKLIVLATSFALFLGAAAALPMERGTGRTLVLGGCTAALLAIAVRQSVRKRKK